MFVFCNTIVDFIDLSRVFQKFFCWFFIDVSREFTTKLFACACAHVFVLDDRGRDRAIILLGILLPRMCMLSNSNISLGAICILHVHVYIRIYIYIYIYIYTYNVCMDLHSHACARHISRIPCISDCD